MEFRIYQEDGFTLNSFTVWTCVEEHITWIECISWPDSIDMLGITLLCLVCKCTYLAVPWLQVMSRYYISHSLLISMIFMFYVFMSKTTWDLCITVQMACQEIWHLYPHQDELLPLWSSLNVSYSGKLGFGSQLKTCKFFILPSASAVLNVLLVTH